MFPLTAVPFALASCNFPSLVVMASVAISVVSFVHAVVSESYDNPITLYEFLEKDGDPC